MQLCNIWYNSIRVFILHLNRNCPLSYLFTSVAAVVLMDCSFHFLLLYSADVMCSSEFLVKNHKVIIIILQIQLVSYGFGIQVKQYLQCDVRFIDSLILFNECNNKIQ